MNSLIQYFTEIKLDKTILWCYLIWYIVIVSFYFEPSFKVWSNSVGISVVIGTGLMLSVSPSKVDERNYWQTFRLYFMPFCVSSFAALIKEQGFIVFVSPKIEEDIVAVLSCLIFLSIISVIKLVNKKFVWNDVNN